MTAYWLARVTVSDPDRFKGYATRVPHIIARYGGRYLARAGRSQVLAGSPGFDRFLVIVFPSFEQALDCYSSAEYQEASSLREGAAEVEIVIVDGVPEE